MQFYHYKGMKLSTIVIDPSSNEALNLIDEQKADDKYWCRWRFHSFFESPNDWRITQLLSESALNHIINCSQDLDDRTGHFIYLDDFLSNDFDDTYYFEIPMSLWYILKDRKRVFANKNIVLSQPAECFFVGLKCDQLYYPSLIEQDPTVLTDLSACKSASVVWDNIDPRNSERFPDINWIPGNIWLAEYAHRQHTFRDNIITHRKQLRENVLKDKKHNFVALLGKTKKHRVDFAQKVLEQNLHLDNEVGTNFREEHDDYASFCLKYEKDNNFQYCNDRDMAPEWYQDCKVWISLETAYNDLEIPSDGLQFSQLTEKTFKPMAYGMPFLVNGGYGIFDYIEELGFKTFKDVFGDYTGSTYEETNNNIIEILKNLDSYNWDLVADHCEHNYDVLMHWTKIKVLDLYLDKLMR